MEQISQLLTNNVIGTCLIALTVGYLVYFIRLVSSYPRGPLPLPVIGNVLHFRGKHLDPSRILQMTEWSRVFGPIYTIWVSHTPVVVINSYDLMCESSLIKRNDFIDRSCYAKFHQAMRYDSQNIISTNGPYWESLRKVSVFAIRRFLNSDKLSEITSEVTDEAIDLMTTNKEPFDPVNYIFYIVYNVLAMIGYGQKFGSIDDQSFKDAKVLNEEFYGISANGMINDFIPWLRPFYYSREVKLRRIAKLSIDETRDMFNNRKKSYEQGVIRDFSDCVLEAKDEAIREQYSRSKYLNDSNLPNVVNDMFQAGTDTTTTALRWAFLWLANDPELQQEIYEEIVNTIGDKKPVQEDKDLLPLTYAFVLEVLRLRPPAPVGIDHAAAVDSTIDGHRIPKGTIIVYNLYAQNTDPKYWTDPLEFNPKRFLDSSGKLMTGRLASFVTFGLGRRACPGDKLATSNAFLIIARLVQKARLELPLGAGTANLVPINVLVANFPEDYQLNCTLRN